MTNPLATCCLAVSQMPGQGQHVARITRVAARKFFKPMTRLLPAFPCCAECLVILQTKLASRLALPQDFTIVLDRFLRLSGLRLLTRCGQLCNRRTTYLERGFEFTQTGRRWCQGCRLGTQFFRFLEAPGTCLDRTKLDQCHWMVWLGTKEFAPGLGGQIFTVSLLPVACLVNQALGQRIIRSPAQLCTA